MRSRHEFVLFIIIIYFFPEIPKNGESVKAEQIEMVYSTLCLTSES